MLPPRSLYELSGDDKLWQLFRKLWTHRLFLSELYGFLDTITNSGFAVEAINVRS